jgi:hypothetical protein
VNNPAEEHPDASLADYSADGLSPAERRRVEAHLAYCAQCRARLRSIETTATLLRYLPPPSLPRSFLLPSSTAPRRQGPRLLVPLSFLSAAAVLFVALGLSLALSRPVATVALSRATGAAARSQETVTTHARAFAAATTAAATSTANAAAAPAAAPAPRPATTASSAQQSTTTAPASAPSLFAAPTRPPASAGTSPTAASKVAARPTGVARPEQGIKAYQVLLGGGGAVCLVVAVSGLLRNGRGPRRRTGSFP